MNHNSINGAWTVKVKNPFKKYNYQISKGTILKVKDKFPDDNGNCEKGEWQIKSPYYGDLFYMTYDERIKYLE